MSDYTTAGQFSYGLRFFREVRLSCFFRRLIERIRPLFIYWKIIIGITVVSFPICIISVYVACTKHGLEAGKLSGAPLYYEANISI